VPDFPTPFFPLFPALRSRCAGSSPLLALYSFPHPTVGFCFPFSLIVRATCSPGISRQSPSWDLCPVPPGFSFPLVICSFSRPPVLSLRPVLSETPWVFLVLSLMVLWISTTPLRLPFFLRPRKYRSRGAAFAAAMDVYSLPLGFHFFFVSFP